MVLEKEPFRNYNLEGREKDVFSVRLNKEERALLELDKKLLRQPKDSTAAKTLMQIGHLVIHEEKIRQIVNTIIENKRRNYRSGINTE